MTGWRLIFRVVIGVGILAGASALYAQEQPVTQQPANPPAAASNAQPTITTDRPAITDSSVVVPRHELVFENGFTETTNSGQHTIDLPETLVRFGLSSKTELRFNVPDYFHAFDSSVGSGWGDLSFGLKQQLLASATGFDVAFVFGLSCPTGAKTVSSHGYDPEFFVPWSRAISKNWTAAGMFGLLWPTEGSRRNLTGQASFYLDRQLTGRWDAFVEYGGEFPQSGGPQHLLHIGSSFKITPNQQADVHAGFGLSAAAPGSFVGFGYSFQLRAVGREKGKSLATDLHR